MEKKDNKELAEQLRRDLARQLCYYLVDNTTDELYWTDTKTHLIELVKYIYDYSLVVSDNGLPLTLKELTERACNRFNVTAPKNLSTYLHNISSIKGLRSTTLLETSIYWRSRKGRHFNISGLIKGAELQLD